MSISNDRFAQYARALLDDEECLNEVMRRLSVHYYREFVEASKETPDRCFQIRDRAATKQDLLSDFLRELRIVVSENQKMHE